MNFPANMTGFVPRLFLFRCLCVACKREYFLHPQGDVISDSGLCPFCDEEVAMLHRWFPEVEKKWKYQPVPPAPAQKELKQMRHWEVACGVIGAVLVVASLYGLCSLFQ